MSTVETDSTTCFDHSHNETVKQSSVLFVLPKTLLFAGGDFLAKTFFSLATDLTLAPATNLSILIVDDGELTKANKQKFASECTKYGITLEYLIADKFPHLVGPKNACDSYLFYQWLSENDHFDIVHLPEWLGYGYFAQLAKHQGLRFQNTHFIIDLHGPSFLRAAKDQVLASPEYLATNFLEKESVRLASSVFALVPLYLRLLQSRGWKLPDSHYTLQLPSSQSTGQILSEKPSEEDATNFQVTKVIKVIYYGLLDERDGLSSFCDAVDKLGSEFDSDLEIVFQGPLASESTQTYLERRAKNWRSDWKLSHLTEQIVEKNCLTVIAGTTTAALLNAVQSSLAGQAFLFDSFITRMCKDEALLPEESSFQDSASLTVKLKQALNIGVKSRSIEALSQHHRQWWKDAHATIFVSTKDDEYDKAGSRASAYQPLVSICLAHFNRPHYLRTALQSLHLQTYQNIEVIVGDDGSSDEGVQQALDDLEALYAPRGWKILRLPHRNVGATRTSIAAAARGEYLLFMDDDNIALPQEIETMIEVSTRTGADIVTCSFDAFEKEPPCNDGEKPLYRKIFLGEALECGLTENVFGDANALIRKSLFLQIGGFDDEPAVAWQDWDFFVKAILAGAHLEAVPEPLYLYRVAADSMNRTSSEWRSAQSIIRQYEQCMPEKLKGLPAILYGLHKAAHQPQTIESGSGSGSGSESDSSPDAAFPIAADEFVTRQYERSVASEIQSESAKPIDEKSTVAKNDASKVATTDRGGQSHQSIAQRLRANRVVRVAWWLATMQLPAKIKERRRRIKQIANSPLFDAQWYRRQHDIGEQDPVLHYLTLGSSQGLDPGPKFSSRWYSERYPDSHSSILTTLEHYIEIGIPLQRCATAQDDPDWESFDSDWYVRRNPDLAGTSLSPFVHFLLFGKAEGRTPNRQAESTYAGFDSEWYRNRYPDTIAIQDAFLDYLLHGRAAGRSINAIEEEKNTFDAYWYAARYPEVSESGLEPFAHYLKIGKVRGWAPFPDADPEARDFDSQWYSHRYPDVEESGLPPLLHYLVYGRREGRLKRPVDGPNSVQSTLRQKFPDQNAMRMFIVPKASSQLTLVLDTFGTSSLFGRKGTAIIFAVLWCNQMKKKLRIVTRGDKPQTEKISSFLKHVGLSLPKSVEFVTHEKSKHGNQLPVNGGEYFICSSWQNAASLLKTVPAEQIIYLVQEDERLALDGHDALLRCSEVLANQKLRFVVDSSTLLQHFIQDGLVHFASNGHSFEPAFSRLQNVSAITSSKHSGKRNFLFYARPDRPATLFYRGLEVIANAIEKDVINRDRWDIYFVGAKKTELDLPTAITPIFIDRLDRADYLELLANTDLALSLMLSPHPGYPTLELAASGAVVISNRFANKISLDSYSKNIICAHPSIEALTDAIAQGTRLAADAPVRAANFAQNNLENDWSKSIASLFQQLT